MNLQAASDKYVQLKNERGHWHNQKRIPAIDDYDGERHQAMKELQAYLGQIGTSADQIEQFMGKPTQIVSQPDMVLQHEFKNAQDPFVYPSNAQIWIYEWRGNHDYVYFVLSKEMKVVRSAWYSAME